MAEARKRHLRELAGNAADLLMSPSNGVRDTLLRSGKTPKDHIRENKQLVKQIQKQVAIKKLVFHD